MNSSRSNCRRCVLFGIKIKRTAAVTKVIMHATISGNLYCAFAYGAHAPMTISSSGDRTLIRTIKQEIRRHVLQIQVRAIDLRDYIKTDK